LSLALKRGRALRARNGGSLTREEKRQKGAETMVWPFHREEQVAGGARYDATGDILSWVQRTFGEADYGMTPVLGFTDSPMGVSDTAVEPPDWLPNLQDAPQDVGDRLFTEVAEEAAADGPQPEPETTLVVITTRWPEATEGEAHIFASVDEAKRFVEHLVDDGFDRECIKTVRGGPAPFNLSFRAVVAFD